MSLGCRIAKGVGWPLLIEVMMCCKRSRTMTIVPQEIESCVLQKRIVVSRYAGITEKSHETYPCRCKGGLLCGKLCLARRGRRRESAEIECEQLALLSNLATIRFLRTVLPCGLLPNQTLTR